MKSVAFHNLGCKVNEYEMEFMQQLLREKGYIIVPFDKKADIYIINTCTVTNIADRKSRQMLHRAKKKNPDAVVVAVGCYVQTGSQEALQDSSIDLAIGNNRKKDIVSILEEYFKVSEKKEEEKPAKEQENLKQDHHRIADKKTLWGSTIIDIAQTDQYEETRLTSPGERTRAFIKIQDGCNQFCSYCAIPYARGRIRSRNEQEVLSEIKGLADKGYKEVVLTGIHLSSYGMTGGSDFQSSRLLDLICRVQEISGIQRIRLGSLEPRIITREFARRLSEQPAVCPHFHLSLQSGCDAVLKRMNRKYTTEEYYEKVCILREYFADPAVTTDVIAGFPQETEAEFEETRSFVSRVGFYEMHIFKYSKRKGTPAAVMEGQIPDVLKTERSAKLLHLGQEMSHGYRQAHIHKEVPVLFEETALINGKRFQLGYTPEYIRAAVETEKNLTGQIVPGRLEDFLFPGEVPEILRLRL